VICVLWAGFGEAVKQYWVCRPTVTVVLTVIVFFAVYLIYVVVNTQHGQTSTPVMIFDRSKTKYFGIQFYKYLIHFFSYLPRLFYWIVFIFIFGSRTDPVSSFIFLFFFFVLFLGRRSSIKCKASSLIFGTILQVNMHPLMESDTDMTSYFQDGGHDVLPPLAAAESTGCRLARRARVMSLVRCMRYSSWSISHFTCFYFLWLGLLIHLAFSGDTLPPCPC